MSTTALTAIKRYEMFIDGKFIPVDGHRTTPVVNPATEAVISEVPNGTASDVDAAVLAAERAQKSWAKLPAITRAGYLREIAQALRKQKDMLARVISEEQGKILPLAEVEVNFSADYLDYMAEFARRYEGEIIQSDRPNENIFLFKAPIGVIGGILPWNFPFFLIVRKMAPALVTGNTIVIKPSSETPNNAFEFAKIVAQSSLPKGVFNLISGGGSVVGKALAGHPKVGMVSITGSVEGGVAVMHAAADNITKVSLELGGKAPAIVMQDADLDLAVTAIRASRIINSGQVCNCAERAYVHESIAEPFVRKMTEAMKATKVGDPFAPGMEMGPMVSKRQMEDVHGAVEQAIKEGAQLQTGGKKYERREGYYYPANRAHQLRPEIVDRAEGSFRSGSTDHHVQRPGSGDRVGQRFRLRAHVVHLHAESRCRNASVQRDQVRRDLHQPRELRSHARLPRGMAEVRHRRRGRQARPGGISADACRVPAVQPAEGVTIRV